MSTINVPIPVDIARRIHAGLGPIDGQRERLFEAVRSVELPATLTPGTILVDEDGDFWIAGAEERVAMLHSLDEATSQATLYFNETREEVEAWNRPMAVVFDPEAPAPEPETPEFIEDRDGDVWSRQADGTYLMGRRQDRSEGMTLEDVRRSYGPLEVVR